MVDCSNLTPIHYTCWCLERAAGRGIGQLTLSALTLSALLTDPDVLHSGQHTFTQHLRVCENALQLVCDALHVAFSSAEAAFNPTVLNPAVHHHVILINELSEYHMSHSDFVQVCQFVT